MRRGVLALLAGLVLLLALLSCATMQPGPAQNLVFSSSNASALGPWSARVAVSSAHLTPGAPLEIQARLRVPASLLANVMGDGGRPDRMLLLVTAERTFDADGVLRLPSDERMSTLVTPTGLAIEGGEQGAVTRRFGGAFRTPVDELAAAPIGQAAAAGTDRVFGFAVRTRLPRDLPPGVYRLRLDFGAARGKRMASLNGAAFARRGFVREPNASECYSPPLRASGLRPDGRTVNAAAIRPRIPWVLLEQYNSNGCRGVVAEEDRRRFALSGRNIIQDEVVLPLYSEQGTPRVLAYDLEPRFPADTITDTQNIPWDCAKGALSIRVTGPDGRTEDLGTANFAGRNGRWPTTRNPAFTRWRPWMYGRYTVRATGWTQDVWGNRYEGGGTYGFWIAKRLTLATATFQGQAYPVGGRYGRDMAFNPAVPAEVTVTAKLFVNSDARNVRSVSSSGRATSGGVFGPGQGLKPLALDAPGEYSAAVLARYTDPEGHLWVCAMHHAGVVYPPDSPIVARGKPIRVGKTLLDRGESHFEGYAEAAGDARHLDHVNFPYRPGDVLLIASEGDGANKIIPVLAWEPKDAPQRFDPHIQGIGLTNVRLATSNGYSPHLFPEFITDWEYYYAGAPRPGLMGRFLVAENGVRSPYWPTSRQSFGGQIGAPGGGDRPGDIYRLLGAVVIRRKGQPPQYAGYMASAFILPKGSNNNRVIAPGAEDLLGPLHRKARFFLATNARPGMVYETGTSFVPAVQIDPFGPVDVTFALTWPDGARRVARGPGDAGGAFVGRERWVLDQPGVYRYSLGGEWMGHPAVVPGLPAEGGEFYVVEKTPPAALAPLRLNLGPVTRIDPAKGLRITGSTTARSVRYAMIMPGAVLAQGELPVRDGTFAFTFDPEALGRATQTYVPAGEKGRVEPGPVVHLTFFSAETAPVPGHSFARLIIRGNMAYYAH